MSRLRPTFGDYVAIAIGPVLIGLLVGSLTFFLIDICYQGAYTLRLKFIMAMFILGSVGVSRISVEEGREYSCFYAVPLALVTALAAFRFVEYRGAAAAGSPIINIGLIALIWWCVDRLIWDCTVIDERERGSGEGLLQTVGLDGPPDESGDAEQQESVLEERVRATSSGESQTMWQRFVEYRRRPHAPGVWVLYFSLAALPIFGLGQLFVNSSDLTTRRSVFHHLVVYVAAALGLLLSTSFLSLRRTLRQRRMEMPSEMARAWLGFGAVMIVAIMLFCTLLPRRNPEYSLTHLPFLASSPGDLSTSPWAFGSDGPEDPQQADRTVDREDSQDPTTARGGRSDEDAAAGSQSDSSGSQSDSGPPQNSGDQSTSDASSQPRDPSQTEPRTQPTSQQNEAGDQSAQTSAQDAANQSRQQPPSHEGQGEQQTADRENGSNDQGRSGEPSDSSGDTQQSQSEQQETGDQPPRDERSSQQQSSQEESSERSQPPAGEPDRAAEDSSQQATEQELDQRQSQANEQSNGARRSSQGRRPATTPARRPRSFAPARVISRMVNSLGDLIKLVYWVVIGLLLIFFLWRYWSQVIRAIRDFVSAIRQWWQRWTGREAAAVDEGAISAAAGPAPPRFAEFVNPFVSGAAERASPDELIKYTFEAFEAWGREHGVPRVPEQTAHEFARAVARRSTPLSKHALQLADLYNWSAFAKERVPQGSVDSLRKFWQQLVEA